MSQSSSSSYNRILIQGRGKPRLLRIPDRELKARQKLILTDIQAQGANDRVSPFCHAYKQGYTTYTCALPHCQANIVIRMDIANFFGSITPLQVYHALRPLYDNSLIVFDYVEHTTVDNALPQGACTSPLIANLVFSPIDEVLNTMAEYNGYLYTRYSDDLYFSTKTHPHKDAIAEFIERVRLILHGNGFTVNQDKTLIQWHRCAPTVCGLLVDKDTPTIPKTVYQNFKDCAYPFRFLDVSLDTPEEHRERLRLLGVYGYIKQNDPARAERLKVYYQWLRGDMTRKKGESTS